MPQVSEENRHNLRCSICNRETSILNFVSVYEPLMCKECRPDLIKPDDTDFAGSISNRPVQARLKTEERAYGKVFGWSLLAGGVIGALSVVADGEVDSDDNLIGGMLITGILLALVVTTVYWIVKSFGQSGQQQLRTGLIESTGEAASDPLSSNTRVKPAESLSEELQKLADLKEAGVLTMDEFQQAKAKLLSK
jgi:hypothetical protein